MREIRQIAALSVQAGRHYMQEAATAPVGASLSRELFNEATKSSRASSLLQGLCSANMREIRQIAALSVQAGRHYMQEAATAPVGASLSRELFNEATKSSRASSLLQGLCSANMREIRQIAALSVQAGRHYMQEAATAPVGASLSRELFNEATKSSRASSLLQGLCSANMREIRQIAALSVQAGRHHRQEAAPTGVRR